MILFTLSIESINDINKPRKETTKTCNDKSIGNVELIDTK